MAALLGAACGTALALLGRGHVPVAPLDERGGSSSAERDRQSLDRARVVPVASTQADHEPAKQGPAKQGLQQRESALLRSPHELALSTADEVLSAEVRCHEKVADACVQVADAYARGQVVPADPQRRARYEKIALTLYVSQCEAQQALACYRLAHLYESGEGVARSPQNAKALLARTLELCGYRANTAFCNLLQRPRAEP